MIRPLLKPLRTKHSTFYLIGIVVLLMIIPVSSCMMGNDGRPGLAYIAFDWVESKPEFIDCGTPAIPANFYYGTYYRTNPGWYTGYYEGKVWNGTAYGAYAWEMDYEIWINTGQRGGYGYNGKDGINTYMNFVCSPYGPYLERHESYLRKLPDSGQIEENSERIDTDEETTILYQFNEYTVRLTYRNVTPENRTTAGNHSLN